MKLRDAFKTYNWLYKQALAENDTVLLEKLFTRKMDLEFLRAVGDRSLYKQLKPETAAFIAQNMTEGVERRWDKYRIWDSTGLLQPIARMCIAEQPVPEMVEAFINSRIPVQKLALMVIDYITAPADRLYLLDRILDKDASRLQDAPGFARELAERGMLPEFDYLVAAGFDLHKDNQLLLRDMAGAENKNFILHAVTKYGADMDVAINTARIAGADKTRGYLEAVRFELYPEAAPLMSFEEMAQEITTLRGTVKALQQMVTTLDAKMQELQNPAKQIDKKPLATPGKA